MSTAQGPAAGAQSNGIEGLSQFLREVWAELHRVQWPTQQTVIKHTIIVVTLVIFMALYIGVLDWGMGQIFGHLLNSGTEL